MAYMENELNEIQLLVARLEPLVKTEGAWIRTFQYGGGPDESAMSGNRAGYLSLGLAFLKGGSSPEDDSGHLDIDTSDLFSEDSDVHFGYFELSEAAAWPLH